MKNKLFVILGIFNIFYLGVIEIIWTFDFPLHTFNIMNVAGIPIFLINIYGLYKSHKYNNKKCRILIATVCVLALYQIISIYAMQYRLFYLFVGVFLIWFGKPIDN